MLFARLYRQSSIPKYPAWDFFEIALTTQDPQVPNLPLETAAAPAGTPPFLTHPFLRQRGARARGLASVPRRR